MTLRTIFALIFAATASAQDTPKSPYELGKYIESHPGADLTAIWKNMGVDIVPTPGCEPLPGIRPCEVEIITLLKLPR